ncbi:MAG: hypothetical protein Kow0042_21310 [Calditrichia bacterium]
MKRVLPTTLIGVLVGMLMFASFGLSQNYVGSSTCAICHNTPHPTLNYNIWEEYNKTGHPYKLNEVSGAPPTFPANTSPGVPNTPPNTTWNDFAYVIGGYGWKARFVKTNGMIFTEDDSAQYNLANGGWVAYHFGQIAPYNYSCFKCHTTGPDPSGSWNGVPTDSLGTFAEPGIRCEGCHGPGGDHVGNPTGIHPPISGDSLKIGRCGDCHQRGGTTNAIPASGGYIQHHEQLNEMKASKHRDGMGGELTCASCHDTHIADRYPNAAGAGLSGIKKECATCHPGHEIIITTSGGTSVKNIECVDCHMPLATKSAIGMQVGNGWQGDVPTHIWHINTDPVPRDSMFEGSFVKLNEHGRAAVTLDFVCFSCHQNKDLAWAASFADDIHTNGIVSIASDPLANLPDNYELLQNYPNPFNPSTTIEYRLPRSSNVKLVVYNVVGQEVATLVDGMRPAGIHKITLDATYLPSGLYVYQLLTGDQRLSKKMILMK